MSTVTVSQVCDTVGRQNIAAAVGVKKAAVSCAVSDNRFPPAWFPSVRALCEKHKIECPEALFGFKSAPKGQKDAAQ